MVAAAPSQAMSVKGTDCTSIKDVVNAVQQAKAVVGIRIAITSIGPCVMQVSALYHAIDVGGGDVVHVATHDEVGGRLVNDLTQFGRILATQGNADVYNYAEQYGDDATARVRQEATSQNMKDLVNAITDVFELTQHAMKAVVVSLEDMKRWDDVIEREFSNMVSVESPRIAKLHAYARSRFAMMTAIDLNNVSGEFAVRGFVEEALKAYLGTDMLQAVKAGTLSQKFLDKHKIDVAELVGHLNDLTMKAVKSAIEVLKEKAMRVVKPGE